MSNITQQTIQNGIPSYDREMIHYEELSQGIYALTYKMDNIRHKYSKDQINNYTDSNNEQKLREVSNYFFFSSGQYRRLVQYYTNILTYDYIVVPKVKDEKSYGARNFEKDYQMILDYTDNSYIEETERFITFVTILDGVFYGYEKQIDNIVSIKQLPPRFCRSKYKINGTYGVEFNLNFFDMYKDTNLKIKLFDMFPDEFLGYYLDYKAGKTKEWVQLDPRFARCHKFQDQPKPLLSDIFLELMDLKEYKEMDKSRSKLDLYKLITQKLPTDKETGLPLLQLEEAKALHSNAKKMINQEGIDVLTSPLDVQAVNLQERGSTVKDNIERATKSVYEVAGTSKILFSSGSDGGSIGLSQSIKTDESVLFPLLDQYKRWRDNAFKKMVKNGKYSFEIIFPKITIYNRKEMFDMYKEAATFGYPKTLLSVAMGIKQTTFMNLINLENKYLNLNEVMIPLQSSHTQSDSSGRPELQDEKLSVNGRKAKDNETNETRAT